MLPSQEVGALIPNDTPHAVLVTLPTWEATVGYEEGERWVVDKMKSGYPRFFIHTRIQELARAIEHKYGREGERCMLFGLYKVAKRCREFISARDAAPLRILQLSTRAPASEQERLLVIAATAGIVFFPSELFPIAKQYWQHSGEGMSSRMAEYIFRELFGENEAEVVGHGKLELQAQRIQRKSPSISALIKTGSFSGEENEREFNQFIEQKYGRVLDLKFTQEAKLALRRRISRTAETEMGEDNVYLYPSGMAAIFNAHQALLQVLPARKAVCFGFPYVDTLNILRKFGPGCHFYGHGDDESLDEMERMLEGGERIVGFFCECPSNPLLKTPNMERVWALSRKYGFAVVVDETVGNFLNISVLPYSDIVVSLLTKVFSGASNVMAGSLILNPEGQFFPQLKAHFDKEYEDLLWNEDALFLERNSRDFETRLAKIDATLEKVVALLTALPLISHVFHPSTSASKPYYDALKRKNGGYGGLISFLFHDPEHAVTFFNAINLHKGPSLGTNFTLACPYTLLAHYQELDEVEEWGVDRNLIRISIGLEDSAELLHVLQSSLDRC